jgi:hypothetical protein
MHKIAATALLLFAFSSAASADVIYQYTGAPFDSFSGSWDPVFGPTLPTQITATIQVASPFPDPIPSISEFADCGHVGTPGFPSLLAGIISGTISDGARTTGLGGQEFDELFLSGCGTRIDQWYLGAIFDSLDGTSDFRDIVSDHTSFVPGNEPGFLASFDRSTFGALIYDSSGMPLGEVDYIASTSAPGQWTVVVTPEINTGALALISGSLLLLGYRRRAKRLSR